MFSGMSQSSADPVLRLVLLWRGETFDLGERRGDLSEVETSI